MINNCKETGVQKIIILSGKMVEIPICDTDCIGCKKYYSCNEEIKLDEKTRDFWLTERDENE